jgi:uncharacterized Zn-finger protein
MNRQKFSNDRSIPEICFRPWEFKCVGEPSLKGHPHVHSKMSNADTILSPYGETRFYFNRRLTSFVAGLLTVYLLTQNMARAEPHPIGSGARGKEMGPCPEYTTSSRFI